MDGNAFSIDTGLVTSCIDLEKHVVMSELWKNEIIGPGQTFTNALAFQNSYYRFSIAHKFSYKFIKNDRSIMRVKCFVEGCLWLLTANQIGDTDFLIEGTFTNEHFHSAQDVIDAKPKARSKLAASVVAASLRMQPETTPNQIKSSFAFELNMQITYKQAWQFKEQSMRIIHGVPDESYQLIPWLYKRIMEADEHAVTEYEATSNHQFSKVFIAYDCSILGSLSGCRPIIYIDGCHLSGPYKGSLLSAIAFDADNQIFPLVYAIVSSEKYEDWYCFLTKLKQITQFVDVTIVSDRHKNILASVAEIFGKENHAYCYRHIKENCSAEVSKVVPRSKTAKDNALKFLGAVMYARLDLDFQKALQNLKTFKPELAEWVLQNQPEHWVVSKFPKHRWDQVTTNVSESFNGWVLTERRHYVSALINEHRDKLAAKLLKAKEDVKSWKNGVGPNIEGKLLQNIAIGEVMTVTPYGQHSAKVGTRFADLNVNLALRTYTCFGWQMSGIPCPHACATIKKFNSNVYEYVEDWYLLSKQLLVYNNLMVPIETHDIPKEGLDVAFTHNAEGEEFLSPPTTRRPPGRPKVKRFESQFMKKRRVHCS